MTQDEIIAMANAAAARHGHTYEPEPADGTVEFLASFAALVAAKERESIAAHYAAQPHVEFFGAELAQEIRARGQKEGA